MLIFFVRVVAIAYLQSENPRMILSTRLAEKALHLHARAARAVQSRQVLESISSTQLACVVKRYTESEKRIGYTIYQNSPLKLTGAFGAMLFSLFSPLLAAGFLWIWSCAALCKGRKNKTKNIRNDARRTYKLASQAPVEIAARKRDKV